VKLTPILYLLILYLNSHMCMAGVRNSLIETSDPVEVGEQNCVCRHVVATQNVYRASNTKIS